MTALPTPDAVALQEAASWFALLRSGQATPQDQAAWQAWLDAAPAHRGAWAQIGQVTGMFQPLREAGDPRAAIGAYRRATAHSARRRMLLGLGALALTGLGAAAWRQHGAPHWLQAWQADYRSPTGQVRELRLADGSQVWMGTASALDVSFNDVQRRLRLLQGEILIATAGDPARPFVVDTPHGQMQALGTRFAVRLRQDDTNLAVYEGAVLARTPTGANREVPAGWAARVGLQGIGPLAPLAPHDEQTVRGLLIARDMPLESLIRELGRYRRGVIRVAPEVARLPVFGSFALTDPQGTLERLQAVLPIRLRHRLPGWLDIGPL